MRKMLTLTLLIIFFSCALTAQTIEEIQQNPFDNSRINYFKRTIVVFNEYLDMQSGSCNTTNIRVILPIGTKSWNFRVDLPLISKSANGTSAIGLGDFSFATANVPYIDEKKGFALRFRIITDSSNDPLLSSGKWIAVPALFYGQFLGKKKEYLWISTIENFSSFAGSNNRKAIETTAYENIIIRYLGKNWIAADVTFRYNGTNKSFPNSFFLELGRKITTRNMAYVHPSIGFGNHKSYNFGTEIGTLIMF